MSQDNAFLTVARYVRLFAVIIPPSTDPAVTVLDLVGYQLAETEERGFIVGIVLKEGSQKFYVGETLDGSGFLVDPRETVKVNTEWTEPIGDVGLERLYVQSGATAVTALAKVYISHAPWLLRYLPRRKGILPKDDPP